MTKALNLNALAQLTVTNHVIGADLNVIFKDDITLEYTTHIDTDIAPYSECASDINTRRVRQSDSLYHQAVSLLTLEFPLKSCQLATIVYTFDLRSGLRLQSIHDHPIGNRHSNDVRQVVLALSIIRRQRW